MNLTKLLSNYYLLAIVSCLLSLIVVFLLKRKFSQQLMDIPNERSSHTVPTPRGGGLGWIVAFAFTSAIAANYHLTNIPWFKLWLILTPLVIIGFIDDRQDVSAQVRYLVQFICAGLAVFTMGSFPQPWWHSLSTTGNILEIIITIIALTAAINFYNFMDGLDGLVAGCSAVSAIFLALYCHEPLWWLLSAALVGFLVWNWSPAQIFMGDVGSTTLGAIISLGLIHYSQTSSVSEAWSAVVVTLPLIADALYTVIRRFWRGENIFQAHRSHIYQRLQQTGWSHAQVATLYIFLTSICASSVLLAGEMGALVILITLPLLILITEKYLASGNLIKL
ncbi:MAG: glycosyltransferase family 4 protein [Cyanobacteria bacterium J083]|nr:MAG: glycosyltransferase family 4 protein [Cyanobacteria bacterium J083]